MTQLTYLGTLVVFSGAGSCVQVTANQAVVQESRGRGRRQPCASEWLVRARRPGKPARSVQGVRYAADTYVGCRPDGFLNFKFRRGGRVGTLEPSPISWYLKKELGEKSSKPERQEHTTHDRSSTHDGHT